MRMSARARLALLLVGCALGACSPSVESAAADAPDTTAHNSASGSAKGEDAALSPSPAAPGPDNCLLVVWQDQDTRDESFDLAHDSADGGAISCATGTSASQFASALAAIRTAARANDKAAILREVGLPLLYIDAEGDRRELTRPDDIDGTFAEVFDEDVLALLREVDLDALTVVPDQGAFVELGSVWLVVDRNGGRPRIVTVNRQALDEAARAMRAQAEAGRGTEAPAKSSE